MLLTTTSRKAVFCNSKFRFLIQDGSFNNRGGPLHWTVWYLVEWILNVHEQHLCQHQLLHLHHQTTKAKPGCQKEGNQGVNLDGSHHPTHQPPSLLHPCGWNHWWWGEPARDDPRFRFHLSQYCSILYIQKSASIVSTICSILYHQHCNTLPNSRDDDGCSQGELVEGCGKGEKRM